MLCFTEGAFRVAELSSFAVAIWGKVFVFSLHYVPFSEPVNMPDKNPTYINLCLIIDLSNSLRGHETQEGDDGTSRLCSGQFGGTDARCPAGQAETL